MGATAIEKAAPSAITGTYHSAQAIDARLSAAQRDFHLCSPFTAVGALPDGCGVQIAVVKVDVDHETYDVGMGKLGLGKSALDRIAHAIGLSWDPQQSHRLDDGRDPHYAHYRAVGRYRASDGQQQIVLGEKEMDLREGSPQVIALEERARRKNKSADQQIREMRLHILAHAETKARLRAIRSMGIRTSYDRRELEKPFACARVVFTGKTADPEMRREFSRMTAASFLGGVHSLYGEQPGHQRQLPAGHAPPPIGAVQPDDEDDFDALPPDVIEHAPAPEAAPPKTRARSTKSTTSKSRGGVIKFGKSKDTPFTEADENTLEWYARVLRESVDNPDKANFRAKNEADLREVEHELARRRGEDEPGGESDGDDWPEG